MKNYTRSYILAGILIAAAFITFFTSSDFTPVKVKDRNASWVLFIGGMVLALVGWREHNKALKNNKNN